MCEPFWQTQIVIMVLGHQRHRSWENRHSSLLKKYRSHSDRIVPDTIVPISYTVSSGLATTLLLKPLSLGRKKNRPLSHVLHILTHFYTIPPFYSRPPIINHFWPARSLWHCNEADISVYECLAFYAGGSFMVGFTVSHGVRRICDFPFRFLTWVLFYPLLLFHIHTPKLTSCLWFLNVLPAP